MEPYTLYDDKRWAVPFDSDVHVLYYNKPMLVDLGFVDDNGEAAPPETWDDYLAIAKAASENVEPGGEAYGGMIWSSQAPLLTLSTYANRLFGYGGRFFNSDGSPGIDSQAAEDALTTLIEASQYLYRDGEFWDSQDKWIAGNFTMYETWPDLGLDAEYETERGENNIKGNWGVVALPKGGANGEHVGPMNSGFSIGVAADTPESEMALAFLELAMSKDTFMRVNIDKFGHIDPVRMSILQSNEFRELKTNGEAEIIEHSLINAVSWSNTPEWWDVQTSLTINIYNAINEFNDASNTKTAEDLAIETLAATLTEWETILAQ